MKAKDMREKSLEDLREMHKSLANEAFQARLKNFTNRLDDTSQIRKLRKDIARVQTILNELARKAGAGHAAAAAEPEAKATAKAPAKKRATKAAKAEKSEATR